LKEILDQIKPDSKVAILAAPTLYCRLFKENPELAKNIYIFEYDKRFSVYDNFIYYDINDPLGNDVKKLEQNSFDYILADPPFWLEEVLLKLFQTIDHLKTHNGKTMICAGPPMTSFLEQHGYKVCKYRPTYERRLSCYNSNQSRIHIDYQSSLMTENNEADEIIFEK